jgi:hypothetical protein
MAKADSDLPATPASTEYGRPSKPDFYWHWENRKITPAIVDEARKCVEAGGSVEDMLGFLRDNGANAIDSIIVLRAFFHLSLKDARVMLHSSETWSELREGG